MSGRKKADEVEEVVDRQATIDTPETGKHTRRSALKSITAGGIGLFASTGAIALGSEEVAASDHVDEWHASDKASDSMVNNWSKQVSDLKLEYIQDEPSYYDYLFTLNAGIVGRNDDDHTTKSHCISNHGYSVTLRTTNGEWSLGEINDTRQHYPADSSDYLPDEHIIEEGMDYAFDLWDNTKLNVAYTAYDIAEEFGIHTDYTDKAGKIRWNRDVGAYSPSWTDVGQCHQIKIRVPKDSQYHESGRDAIIKHWGDNGEGTATQTQYDLYLDRDGGVPGVIYG